MSQPTQTCTLCGNVEVVTPDGRGFPPGIAKRKLIKRCRAQGCRCEPVYRAGVVIRERGPGRPGKPE